MSDNPFWKEAIALALWDLFVTEQSYCGEGTLEVEELVPVSVAVGAVVSVWVVSLDIGAELAELRVTISMMKQK